jgi:hypothetical protein
MDIILKEIVAIIKEETENINKKIYGTTFLEILKEKILNRQDQISLKNLVIQNSNIDFCLLYTSPSPRDGLLSRMPSSA